MRPQETDYPAFFQKYVALANGEDIKEILSRSQNDLEDFLNNIPQSKADYAYGNGKWTVKEVLQHCIDSERIFAYRALCHARGEQQPLPGFDQEEYATYIDVQNRSLNDLKTELLLIRQTTTLLFNSFSAADMERTGFIGENPIKAFCWGFIITGHFIHHQNILQSKYFV